MSVVNKEKCKELIEKVTKMECSDSGAEELSDVLEEIGIEVAKEAGILAKHRDSDVVDGKDIKLASR